MARLSALLIGVALFSVSTKAQFLQGAAPGASIAAPGAGAAAAAAAPIAGPCGLGIDFFPAGNENKPTGWTEEVQASVGNTARDQLVKIALAGYPIPHLFMSPVSVFTNVNGQIPGQCIGSGAAGVLVQPAAFTITWAVGGVGAQLGPYTKGSKEDPPASVKLNIVPELPDGDYCLQLKMDVLPGSGVAVVGAQRVAVPATAQSISRQVCFHKLASRPTADVTFHSCNTSFAVDLAKITPRPAFANPQVQLYSTVFHVWGKLNRTFTATPPADNLLDYFDQYVKWEDPAKPNFLQVFMDSPGLINGYYNVWIEGSLATQHPNLVSLFGNDQFDDGTAKFMGVSLRNSSNRAVPIQTVKSEIGNLAGPDIPVPIGSAASFNWETAGYGEQFCFVDGQRVANSADGAHCEAPLNLRINDNGNHTLEVLLVDVCGEKVMNGLFFGSWGWRLNPRFAPPPPPPPPPEPVFTADPGLAGPLRPAMTRNRTTSGAAAAVTSSLASLAAAVFGLFFVL